MSWQLQMSEQFEIERGEFNVVSDARRAARAAQRSQDFAMARPRMQVPETRRPVPQRPLKVEEREVRIAGDPYPCARH